MTDIKPDQPTPDQPTRGEYVFTPKGNVVPGMTDKDLEERIAHFKKLAEQGPPKPEEKP